MDLVLRGARVVDGTGGPSYPADVGVRDGRIAEIRRPAEGPRPARGVRVSHISDQHLWLDVPPEDTLEVGDWVCLGLSHPCTTFDKWQLIPQAEPDGTVTDYIRTFF